MTPVRVPEITEWVRMYESGMSLSEIAAVAGRSTSTVYQYVSERTELRFAGRIRSPRGGTEPVVCGRRICSKCRRWRHVSDFGYRSYKGSKMDSQCIGCRRAEEHERRIDPQRHADRIEYKRIWQEARRRKRGIESRNILRPLPPDPKNPNSGRNPEYLHRELDPAPLVEAFREWSRAQRYNGHGVRLLALQSGVPERRVSAVVNREQDKVHVANADKMCVAMGLTLKMVYPDA